MYGLILSNFSSYLVHKYGEDAWDSIRRLANVDNPNFTVHQVYPEQLLGRIAKKAFQTLGVKDSEFFAEMGYFFVEFVGRFGYGDVLALLGRQLRDFLNGLDNLHEYLKFSYPRLRAPSYFCDNETETGLHLHYRSKRRGFTHYTMGQLKSVAETFYKLKLEIEVLDQEVKFDTIHVSFKLTFDNKVTDRTNSALIREEARLPAVSSSILFEIFPFIIVYGEDMAIQTIGRSLTQILPNLIGQKMNEFFDLVRPIIEFQFDSILARSNNIFEIMTVEPIDALLKEGGKAIVEGAGDADDEEGMGDLMGEEEDKSLHLKGQMMFMPEWGVIMFLSSPSLKDLDMLAFTGLYINDLSMHDFSRDLLLAASSQSNELKDALDAEMEKSKLMEESMKRLDMEVKRSDELLAQMIPKQVAEKVKAGANPVDTCETFEQVTIVFNDIPEFGDICSKCDGMQIVGILNTMFGIFDVLSDRNDVYKVETVKDSFVGVAGAPEKSKNHAEKIMDMALDMRDCVAFVKDPRPDKADQPDAHIKIRLGSHSGMVVAGVVGNKMPRYCLFGDAMNTSSRMMSFGDAQCIHISSATKELLPATYVTRERGKITVKGKGEMVTFWLDSKSGRAPPSKDEILDSVAKLAKENALGGGGAEKDAAPAEG